MSGPADVLGSQEIDRWVGQGFQEIRKGTGCLGGEEEASGDQAEEIQEVHHRRMFT